jgi:hypothetical protein
MIRISELPLIENAGQFHAAKLILLVDALLVGDTPRNMREYIKNTYGAFIHDKQTYIPITLTGTPDSLLTNAGKIIQFKFDRGFESHYHFDGNLGAAIWHKKLYDLSGSDDSQEMQFEREPDFIIDRYIVNVQEYIEPEQEPKLLNLPPVSSGISLKTMHGLKPVRKG